MRYLSPSPVLEMIDGIAVVRDDYVPGGTKQRALEALLPEYGPGEYVYAGPVTGFAGLALAYACAALGPDYKATLFQAERKHEHARTTLAKSIGASVETVLMGRLSNVKAKARRYCHDRGATLLPWGMEHPDFINVLASIAREVDYQPTEVWTVAGSGVLSRALQLAWPEAEFHAVNISDHKVNAGRATVYKAPERFEDDASEPPPFASCSNYDAKAWRFIKQNASAGTLFWNCAG